MSQIKANEVKWGINTRNSQIPSATRFGTQTTTRSSMPKIQMPAYGSLGLYNLTGGQQSRQGALNTPTATGGTPNTGNGVLNTTTSNQTTQATTPSREQQIASLTGQMNGLQSQLDARRAAEQANQSNKATSGRTNSFQGILNTLLGRSQATGEQDRVRKEMERVARQNRAIGDEAKRISDQYGAEIARVGNLGAGAVAGNLSTGTNVVGSGNAAIASQSASQRMQALGTAQQAALKGTEQQLTAQQQTTEGLAPSLQAALTQQQQQLSGLGTAAGLAAPMQIPYSAGGFDPLTGQQIAGGFGGWAGYTNATQAQDLIAQYPDAGVQYNPNLTPEQNLEAIRTAIGGSPTYQQQRFGAAGATSYIGAQQLGAAGTLTGQVAQLQTVGNAADANFNLILDIAKRGNINDLNQPVLNQLAQGISRGLTSDQDLIAFRSGLQTVRSQYAAILGGGTPTDATQAMAAEKIPDTVSLSALQEVERTMKSLINNTIASYNQQIGAYSGGGRGGNSFAEEW